MPQFLDYKEEIKRLLSESYVPADTLNKEFEMTTNQLLLNLRNILPYNSIDEFMVYEALLELGFKPNEKTPLEYFWYFRRV